jgi:hypothetical protein
MMTWLRAVPGALGLVPRWVWYALAAALAWHFVLAWHRAEVRAHDTEILAARDAQWQARLDELRDHSIATARNAEAQAAKINTKLKDIHDAQVRSDATDAHDLLVRGPGKAAAPAGCRPVGAAGIPGAAGGPERADRAADPAANPLHPDDGLALVPWSWLVQEVGQPADGSRAEVIAWRGWYGDFSAWWEDYRRQLQAAAKVKPKADGKPAH